MKIVYNKYNIKILTISIIVSQYKYRKKYIIRKLVYNIQN